MAKNLDDSLSLEAIGGCLWLDFANSLQLARIGLEDPLDNSQSWKVWLERRMLQVRDGLEIAQAIILRKNLRDLSLRLAAGGNVSDATLDEVNECLASQRRIRKLSRAGEGFRFEERRPLDTSEDVLDLIMESFANTLAEGDQTRLRKCEASDCELVFYDSSKAGRRRWCSMSGCGNRAKAHAYHERRRGDPS